MPAASRRGSSRSHSPAASMTAVYDPTDPRYFDRGALHRGARPRLRPVPRVPPLFQPVPVVPDHVRVHRRAGRRRLGADRGRARPGGRRVLPVQALLREVPLRASARVEARLPAPDEPGPRRAHPRGPGAEGARDGPVPGPHRRAGYGVGGARTGGELGHGHPRFLDATGHGEDRRAGVGAVTSALRAPALHDLVRPQEAGSVPVPAGSGGRSRSFPPASSSTWIPTSARTWYGSTSTTGWRARCPRGPRAAARPGCTRATWSSSRRRLVATWPRWRGRCGPGVTSSWPSRPAPTSSSGTTPFTPRAPTPSWWRPTPTTRRSTS